jgi:hypothetical protein
MADKSEKTTTIKDAAPASEPAPAVDVAALVKAEVAKVVAEVKKASQAEIDKAREEVFEAHDRISQLQEQIGRLASAPPSGSIGADLKALLAELKGKDAQAADHHEAQKKKHQAKRVEIFEKTKKDGTHVFYKIHQDAFVHGVLHAAGSIISMPLNKDEPEKHLPSITWSPVGEKVVTTELSELPLVDGNPSRAADQPIA